MVSLVSQNRLSLDHQSRASAAYLAITAFYKAKALQKTLHRAPSPQDATTTDIVKLMLRGRSLRFIAHRLNIPVSEVTNRVAAASKDFPEGSNIELVARILYAPKPVKQGHRAAVKQAAAQAV